MSPQPHINYEVRSKNLRNLCGIGYFWQRKCYADCVQIFMRSRFYSIFKFAKLVCMQERHGLGSREFLNVSEKNKYNLCEALLEIARFSEKLQFFILHDRICRWMFTHAKNFQWMGFGELGFNHLFEWNFVPWTHPLIQAQNRKCKFWLQFCIFIPYILKVLPMLKCHIWMECTWTFLYTKWMQ